MFICESRLYARHPAQPRSFHDVKISAQSIDLDQSLPFARQSAQPRRLPWHKRAPAIDPFENTIGASSSLPRAPAKVPSPILSRPPCEAGQGFGEVLKVLGAPPISFEPGKGALDHPGRRMPYEARQLAADQSSARRFIQVSEDPVVIQAQLALLPTRKGLRG
jgi:hypothetical protein